MKPIEKKTSFLIRIVWSGGAFALALTVMAVESRAELALVFTHWKALWSIPGNRSVMFFLLARILVASTLFAVLGHFLYEAVVPRGAVSPAAPRPGNALLKDWASSIDVVVSTAQKDLIVYLRQWKTILTSLVMPATYILVALLGSIAVGRNPVALVVQDQNPVALHVAQAVVASDVFRVARVDAVTAENMYANLQVGAILTIPQGFSQAVQSHRNAPILVKANNLNLDFMNDVRRSVPDAITVYYGSLGASSPLSITVNQRNLRSRDVSLFQYDVVPLITLLVCVCGLIASSAGTARELETLSIKEVLLAPTSRVSVILGKVMAGWFATFCMGLLMFTFGYAFDWTRPTGLFIMTTLLAIALVSLFASVLGIALGCLLRRVQSVNVLSTTGSVWLFFLAGGLGIIQFEPVVLRQIAAWDPLTYGTHMLQMAVFYSSFDRLGQDVAVLMGAALALFSVCVYAMRPGQIFRKGASV